MATTTTNLGLSKPAATDAPDIAVINDNMDKIDAALAGKAASNHTHSTATQSASGFQSADDKKKLDGIEAGANKTTVDSAMSSSSTNPVQNKVVQAALDVLSKIINDIDIGGRNLLTPQITPGGNTGANTGYYDIKLPCASNGDTYFHIHTYEKLEVNQTYTLSFTCSGLVEGTVWEWMVYNKDTFLFYIKNGRVSYTFTVPSSDYSTVNILIDDRTKTWASGQTGNAVIFSEFKLEKGNKATDWTPSPESVKSLIDSKFPSTGGIITGAVNIQGAANSKPLQVRGIVGSDGTSTVGELYLQYGANAKIYLGNTGSHNISGDGSNYTGNSATATKATNDGNGRNIVNTYLEADAGPEITG